VERGGKGGKYWRDGGDNTSKRIRMQREWISTFPGGPSVCSMKSAFMMSEVECSKSHGGDGPAVPGEDRRAPDLQASRPRRNRNERPSLCRSLSFVDNEQPRATTVVHGAGITSLHTSSFAAQLDSAIDDSEATGADSCFWSCQSYSSSWFPCITRSRCIQVPSRSDNKNISLRN
jgi:hypothetical protein